MLGQLADAVAEVTAALDAYDFAAAVKALYRFIWNDVCDWYLEAAKARLYGDDAARRARRSRRRCCTCCARRCASPTPCCRT